MNRSLKPKELVLVALALVAVLALGGLARRSAYQAELKRQNSAMVVQMNREMGMPTIDNSGADAAANPQEDDRKEWGSAHNAATNKR